jgi:excisionase family DNA binding protein
VSERSEYFEPSQRSRSSEREDVGDGGCLHPAEFLSVKEVAAVLHVSYNSVLTAIHNGSLVGYRFGPRGGTYRVKKADLSDYIATSCTRRNRVQSKPKRTASPFKKLDGERLLRAWREQGISTDRCEEVEE